MKYTATLNRFIKTDDLGNLLFNIPLNTKIKTSSNTIFFSDKQNTILFCSYNDFTQLTDENGVVFTKTELSTFNIFSEKIKNIFAKK